MSHTPPGRTRERVYRFVRDRLLAGEPPSVREVQQALGFRAVESARAQLEALVREGRLVKEAGARRAARGYRMPAPWRGGGRGIGRAAAPVAVPVLGRVQAGALTEAAEDAEDAVAVASRFPPEELFALRVRGDSMRGAGILDGDLVVVRRQPTADDGAIVVALVRTGAGDEATVKRLRRVRLRGGGTRVELHPENPEFDVIVPDAGATSVLGRVIEVRRSLDPGAPPRRSAPIASGRAPADAPDRARGAPPDPAGR